MYSKHIAIHLNFYYILILMTYIDHIKNSVFATGCAPTLKVHLYVIRLITKILFKFALQEKKVFIFIVGDCVRCIIPKSWKKTIKFYNFWRDKYLNYLIHKDWTKIDYWYFGDEEKWNNYLNENPERKKYFEKRSNQTLKLVEIFLDQERVDSYFMSTYAQKYM